MEYVSRVPAPPLDEFIDDIYCLKFKVRRPENEHAMIRPAGVRATVPRPSGDRP